MIKITPIGSINNRKKRTTYIDPWQVSTVKAIDGGIASRVSLANGEHVDVAESPRTFSGRVVAAKNAAPPAPPAPAPAPAPVTAAPDAPLRWKGIPNRRPSTPAEKARSAHNEPYVSDIVALLNDENKRLRAALKEIAEMPDQDFDLLTEKLAGLVSVVGSSGSSYVISATRAIKILVASRNRAINIARAVIGQTVK